MKNDDDNLLFKILLFVFILGYLFGWFCNYTN